MELIIVENYEELSKKAAQFVTSQVILKPEGTIGLATGSTPVGMYAEIVKMYRHGIVDFSKIKTFNLDEYYDLSPDNDQSYIFFMNENLFNHVNLKKENISIPDGMTKDIQVECDSYEKKIRESGGIDLQILGIGRNGHIGFNEPDVKFEATTHIVELDEGTIQDNSRFFDSIDDVPKQAISVGIKTIMQARKIVLLATGKEKAQPIYEMIHGKITPNLPASVLQLHPNVTVIMDREAASLLK